MSTGWTVLTYNTHGFTGRDGRYAPQRIFRVVQQINAEVVALQEVQADDPGLIDELRGFAEQRHYQLILGPTILARKQHLYGNALLLRGAVSELALHDISYPEREPRGVIDVRAQLHGEPWRIVATHLGLSPAERRYQVKNILELLKKNNGNTILLGDLNEWFAWGKPMRWLKNHFGSGHSRRTFPSSWPLLSLDRIWVHPHQRVLTTYSISNPASKIASDHLPLVTEIAMMDQASGD